MTADTPVPRQLSEEERALWEKAATARKAMEAVTQPFTLTTTAHDRGMWSLLGEKEHASASAWCQLASACKPSVILSLLTALSSEREAGKSDARRMKEHVRGCGECSAGDFCDEGESYGGEVTSNYLYRITAANGCRADAVERSIAERRATRSTGGE